MILTLSQWQNGRRGQDGWGRWTRRRKWYRDAELVEADDAVEQDQPANATNTPSKPPTPASTAPRPPAGLNPTPAVPTVDLTPSSPDNMSLSPPSSLHNLNHHPNPHRNTTTTTADERDEEHDSASVLSTSSRSARFALRRRVTDSSHRSERSRRRASVAASSEDDAAVLATQTRIAVQEAGAEAGSWGVGDDVRMGLE